MTIQTRISEDTRMLNFADLFVDGCEVRFVQGADCKARAALPDGSLVDLGETYRGRLKPSDFHFEYAAEECPQAAFVTCPPKPVWV